MFLKTIRAPVILTKAMVENFLHPLRNLMLWREIRLNLNLTGQQNLTLPQIGDLFKLCITQIWTVVTPIFMLMKTLHTQYFNKYRFKVLTDVQYKKVKETFSKRKIEFLDMPFVNEVIMASKSVRNNIGLLKGDSSLSNIQERLTYSTFPPLDLMQKFRQNIKLS